MIRSQRIRALDALRAIMMLLGFVAHAAPIYGTVNYGELPGLVNPIGGSRAFDFLFEWVHSFRVPTFFLASGYFGALLFYRRGALRMLRNRAERILLPLIAGVVLIYPLNAFAFVYSLSVLRGLVDPWNYAWAFVSNGHFFPLRPDHLWFLYYLVTYSALTCGLFTVVRRFPEFEKRLYRLTAIVLSRSVTCLLLLGGLIFANLVWSNEIALATTLSFHLTLKLLAGHYVCYFLGWMIYSTETLSHFRSHSWGYLTGATLILTVALWLPRSVGETWFIQQQVLRAFATALFVLGFLAVFLRYFEFESPSLSYVVDASYWVYIVHLPLMMFSVGLIHGYRLPVALKFVFLILLSAVPSFVTYHFFVRDKWIGRFLSGSLWTGEKKPGQPVRGSE